MLFDLSRLHGGTEHVQRRFDPAAVAIDAGDFRIVAPVELDLHLTRDARKIRVVGTVATTLECECSRCLEPFPIPVDARVDLTLLPVSAAAGRGETELQADDVGVSYYTDETLDLGALMREQFYLALPMKPLCAEECRGLCPVCGTNRNRSSCHCTSEWVDPRFEMLRRFRS